MKYLLLILLALLAFHCTYSQLPDDTTADLDPFAEEAEEEFEEQASGVGEVVTAEENEEQASGVGEVVTEEENETVEVESGIIEELAPSEAVEVVEALEDFIEEEGIPDANGYLNVSTTKFLSNAWNQQVVNNVILWQIYSLEAYGLFPTYYAFQLDKINYIQYIEAEKAYRINLRIHDVEVSNNFFTGHSVVQIGQNPKSFNIIRSKYGLNSEVAEPFTDPAILNIINTNWSSIDPGQAQQDPAFINLLDYAVNTTKLIAIPRALPKGDWSLKSLEYVSIQAKDNGNVYHLTVIFAGPNSYTAHGEIAVLKKPDGTNSFIGYGFDTYLQASD